MKLNMVGLPFLDKTVLHTIFEAAADPDAPLAETIDPVLKDFTEMLAGMARYNLKNRQQQLNKLAPVIADSAALEPYLSEPEQARMVLGLILAIKELYGMRPDTLKLVLRQASAGD